MTPGTSYRATPELRRTSSKPTAEISVSKPGDPIEWETLTQPSQSLSGKA